MHSFQIDRSDIMLYIQPFLLLFHYEALYQSLRKADWFYNVDIFY